MSTMTLPAEPVDIQPLAVLYQDDYLVAVDKPAGVLVHRSPGIPDDGSTLLQLLRDQLGRYLFPVHRLDRPTSGVIVYALQSEVAASMNRLFSKQRVVKRYRAVVRGWLPDEGRIDLPLRERQPDEMESYEQASRPLQAAATRYRTCARFDVPWSLGAFPSCRYAELELWPETGRWHQIRRHLNHLSHPIVGDHRHGDHRHNQRFAQSWNIERMLLAAEQIEFDHPVHGERLSIAAPLGQEFERALQHLKLYAT